MTTPLYNIYVVHGYTANSTSNWFPYLKHNLETEQTKVHVFDMPNSQHPSFDEWINHLEQQITETNQKSIFIGHSLGCVTILNYLMNKNLDQVVSTILVSGFVEQSPIQKLAEFMHQKIDYKKIINGIPNRVIISAQDDDIIPPSYSEELAKKIQAEFILLDHGKHFIDRDGFYEFPLLVDLVKKITHQI